MSTRKLIRAIESLFQQIWRLARTITKGFINWLLRSLLILGRQPLPKAGFVLPTVTLLLLVLALTVGSLAFRTFTRTTETIGERQQRVIYNAATPAIDRAKAKIEFLFNPQNDPRFPGGIPAEQQLLGMMLNDGRTLPSGVTVSPYTLPGNVDPYKLPDETRLDINNDGRVDNAWSFPADLDGDGTNDARVAYSILFQTPATRQEVEDLRPGSITRRANSLQVRHGPLSNEARSAACAAAAGGGAAPPQGGWFVDDSNPSILRKNFQINAYVLPLNPDGTPNRNGTATTLEFEQDREVNRGNKWGAWFRNDLEIFPGPQFNWNGAMHTEGNLVVGGSNDRFTAYLISAPASCLYERTASEVTVTSTSNDRTNTVRFEGQIVNGTIRDNDFSGSSTFHLHDRPPILGPDNNVKLTAGTDSVTDGSGPASFALDPIRLHIEDISAARGVANPTTRRDNNVWNDTNRPFVEKRRIYNQTEPKPSVDDSFRADNRYGPKPTYGLIGLEENGGTPGINSFESPRITNIGETIRNDQRLIGDDPAAGAEAGNVGLDGYWERRARREGMRLLVGQRLDLGNTFGWQGAADSLYPPSATGTTCDANTAANRCHEARQRRTLRDNLAAVQAMAVYHFAGTGGRDFPSAFMATTAHPGTPQSISDSKNLVPTAFKNAAGVDTLIYSDFLKGKGTNGWEFFAPTGTALSSETAFSAAIGNAASPLRIALKNLATFAGDPRGGAPSFTPIQDNLGVHPAPNLNMWGDFSHLRRVLQLIDAGTTYAQLSPADKTYLHTAAATLGMLAYQVNLANGGIDLVASNSTSGANRNLVNLGQHIWQLMDGQVTAGNTEMLPKEKLSTYYYDATRANGNGPYNPNDYKDVTTEQIISRLVSDYGDDPALANLVFGLMQIQRDRAFGFRNAAPPPLPGLTLLPLRPGGFEFTLGRQVVTFNSANLTCDPNSFNDVAVQGGGGGLDQKKLGLAMVFCNPSSAIPKYPALYYLFPGFNHDHNGGQTDTNNDGAVNALDFDHRQPGDGVSSPTVTRVDGTPQAPEPYITDAYITRTDVNGTADEASPYKLLNTANIASLRLEPRTSTTGWVLPVSTTTTGRANLVTGPNGAVNGVAVPFLDKALFNGREMMSVRTLDVDLEMIRTASNSLTDEFWLPRSGIVYAFREDAVREDEIVRPANSPWSTCGNNSSITSANCRTNATGTTPQDPPLSSTNLISPKSVDYYPDPARRPHAFRLRNGIDLQRPGDRIGTGLSFITDNPVYIQGDFNLHQTGTPNGAASGTRLEEFTQLLPAGNYNPAQFYNNRTTLDGRFARPTTDRWRPAEILADAITILSNNFCDGSIEDSWLTAGSDATATISATTNTLYGCSGNANRTSYLNQNRPNTVVAAWQRENPADPTSPIKVTSDGNPVVADGTLTGTPYSGTYYAFSDLKPRIASTANTRVNAIVISGLVPSRANQSYGGLHNFPRFLEEWNNLYFSGSFIQLSFSNYATAPFDQDAWEPSSTSNAAELIPYYGPPNRFWGYDVGLQIAPAGPLARRFVNTQAIRSEFYDEPPSNDQYIKNLCNAVGGSC